MSTCDRCGCEIDDYYYIDYIHSNHCDNGHIFLCPSCKKDLDDFLFMRKTKIEGKHIKKHNTTASITFTLPDGYEIIRGEE